MKKYIRSDTRRGLNEDERDYLRAKLEVVIPKIFPDYDIDNIQSQGNRFRFGVYNNRGELMYELDWVYRPDFEDGPEEQLDDWLDDLKYQMGVLT